MPIDSASSSPSSRRTIIVRLAHGHARATTSRYRPASAGSVPSRPSAVIRSFRYLVSRTNSPVAPTLPTLPHCSAFQLSAPFPYPRPSPYPAPPGTPPHPVPHPVPRLIRYPALPGYPRLIRYPAPGIPVAVVAPDPARGPLPLAVHTMWMSQPCRSSCMNGTFTSYAVVRMMPAGQATQQQRRTTCSTGPATSAAPGRYLPPSKSSGNLGPRPPALRLPPRPTPLQPQRPQRPHSPHKPRIRCAPTRALMSNGANAYRMPSQRARSSPAGSSATETVSPSSPVVRRVLS